VKRLPLELFDRDRDTCERPLAGSERWMQMVAEDPDPFFRLFVELWSYAQRDERLRARLADGLGVMRAMFARFGAASAADAGLDVPARPTRSSPTSCSASRSVCRCSS
jgi:hypothetical protein